MSWTLLSLVAFFLASGMGALVFGLHVAGVEDGSPLNAPNPDLPLDRAWHEAPVQTFMWQVQVARYWQPPFCRR